MIRRRTREDVGRNKKDGHEIGTDRGVIEVVGEKKERRRWESG